jgi:hypothetical protein
VKRRGALLTLPALALTAVPGHARPPVQPVQRHLRVAGSRIELQFDDQLPAAVHAGARAWALRSASAVAAWLGRLPLPEVELLLQAVGGAGVKGGTAFAEPAPYIRIRLGRDTRARHLAHDRVLVHELLHLAVPRMPQAHLWLHEGIATYGEGAVRVQAGMNTAQRWWGELVRGLPQGQPDAGDAGLDHTPTWARTYWGGALFCLQADVAMRRVHPRRGLREALQGLLAAGGSYAASWPIARVLDAADAAVGGQVLAGLYEQHRNQPVAVDLPALWQALGVVTSGTRLPRLDDDAPLAAARRAIAA